MRLVLELLELIRTGNEAVIGGKYIIEFIPYIVSFFIHCVIPIAVAFKLWIHINSNTV